MGTYKQKLVLWFILVVLCGIGLSTVQHAEAASSKSNIPLILRLDAGPQGHFLAAWDGVIPRIFASVPTDYQFGNPALSPDGSKVVYTSFAEDTERKASTEDIPVDIYLMPMSPLDQVGSAVDDPETLIIGQPTGSKLKDGPRKYVVRSDPVWSPGGETIAWAEYTVDESAKSPATSGRLMSFSLSAKKERVLSEEVPLQSGSHRLTTPQWNKEGLLYAMTNSEGHLRILLYGTGGKPKYAKSFSAAGQAAWVQTSDGVKIALGLADPARFKLVDYKADALYDLAASPRLANFAVTKSIVVQPDGGMPGVWVAASGETTFPCGDADPTRFFPDRQFGISPDGKMAACVDRDGSFLVVTTTGATSQIRMRGANMRGASVVGISWGPASWGIIS